MPKRFVSIWFRTLKTDWFTRRQPALKTVPFVLASPDHGRMVVSAINSMAATESIYRGMAVADARAIVPFLQVQDDDTALAENLLKGIAAWCIRFTPVVGVDLPDGLILDATGCAHLWGGEEKYLADINTRIQGFGYAIKTAMADSIGAAWALARFGQGNTVVAPAQQAKAMLALPVIALRLEPETAERLEKLGLRHVSNIINMQRTALRRRFGTHVLMRLNQALGVEEEYIQPVHVLESYKEWLPCLEPIVTATGIEMAIQKLTDAMCIRLTREGKGFRMATITCYRIDGRIQKLSISTNHPSRNSKHIFKLFEIKIDTIEPALGIELFTLEAFRVEDAHPFQEKLWNNNGGIDNIKLAELLDRIGGRIGDAHIHRFVPDEHYWPERSFKKAISLNEKPHTDWKLERPRPIQILDPPVAIDVTAPIPDYPPMLFRYKGKLHRIVKADGPERIEQEWWLQEGKHRDYYIVEDEAGKRYWLFRSGHYDASRSYQWFIHGFFA
jgi:protein ImuB